MTPERLGELADRLVDAGLRPRRDEPLAPHTTFRIGGPADLYVEAVSADELTVAITAARAADAPLFLLGGGSNLLVLDGGMEGLVVADRTRGWSLDGSVLRVASGEPLAPLVETLAAQGVGGLDFLAGIPGTVGGAVTGNAGAYGRDTASVLLTVRILRDGAVVDVRPGELEYAYRASLLKRTAADGAPAAVVLEAQIRVDPAPAEDPMTPVAEILEHRAGRLPTEELGCAGSWFKNLPPEDDGGMRRAAGYLLDQVGCKGMRSGDAEVFARHANIIVNRGRATARDVLALSERMRGLVAARFGIYLETEVMTVGRESAP